MDGWGFSIVMMGLEGEFRWNGWKCELLLTLEIDNTI
jgi:hypothetical protein